MVGDDRRGMVDDRRATARTSPAGSSGPASIIAASRRRSTEWPSISSQFGILDTCGFPKDNYYYYRAWWRPDEPLVHLLPHWNWPGREGQPIEVWAHGNTEEVELRLNGRSLGRKAMPRNRHLEWQRAICAGAAGGDRIQRRSRGRAGHARDQRPGAARCRLTVGPPHRARPARW